MGYGPEGEEIVAGDDDEMSSIEDVEVSLFEKVRNYYIQSMTNRAVGEILPPEQAESQYGADQELIKNAYEEAANYVSEQQQEQEDYQQEADYDPFAGFSAPEEDDDWEEEEEGEE